MVLCLECAGVHRSLGVHISQCRSFNLGVLAEYPIDVGAIGNTLANEVWEERLESPESKPSPKSTREIKEAYIKRKYVERSLVGPGQSTDISLQGTDLRCVGCHGDMHRLIRHVAYNTDLDFVSEHGATALSAAAHRGHPAPITLLLLNHANVNKCGDAGWSPLHAAMEASRKLFDSMAKGGDEMAKERHGQTPIDIAIRCGHETCVILMGGEFPATANASDVRSGTTQDSTSYSQVAETPACDGA